MRLKVKAFVKKSETLKRVEDVMAELGLEGEDAEVFFHNLTTGGSELNFKEASDTLNKYFEECEIHPNQQKRNLKALRTLYGEK